MRRQSSVGVRVVVEAVPACLRRERGGAGFAGKSQFAAAGAEGAVVVHRDDSSTLACPIEGARTDGIVNVHDVRFQELDVLVEQAGLGSLFDVVETVRAGQGTGALFVVSTDEQMLVVVVGKRVDDGA